MSQIHIKKLSSKDLEQVYDIDRSESVQRMYRAEGEVLKSWEDSIELSDDPAFWKRLLGGWKDEVESGADAYGAFDEDRMAGLAILKHGYQEGVDQIIALYVSAEYRLSGIAKSLYLEMEKAARKSGAKKLFVSTTPTGSAVGFYLSQGFEFDVGSSCSTTGEKDSEIPMTKRL